MSLQSSTWKLNLTRLDLLEGSTKRHETVTEELAKLESVLRASATADILKSKKVSPGRFYGRICNYIYENAFLYV
jgi:hypothetical protein